MRIAPLAGGAAKAGEARRSAKIRAAKARMVPKVIPPRAHEGARVSRKLRYGRGATELAMSAVEHRIAAVGKSFVCATASIGPAIKGAFDPFRPTLQEIADGLTHLMADAWGLDTKASQDEARCRAGAMGASRHAAGPLDLESRNTRVAAQDCSSVCDGGCRPQSRPGSRQRSPSASLSEHHGGRCQK